MIKVKYKQGSDKVHSLWIQLTLLLLQKENILLINPILFFFLFIYKQTSQNLLFLIKNFWCMNRIYLYLYK